MAGFDTQAQYEVAGYVGMTLCGLYGVACVHVLWEICEGKVFSGCSDSGKLIQKLIIFLLVGFNVMDFPQYESFVRRSSEELKLEGDSYSLHLFAIWQLYASFALFTLLWQRLLQLPEKIQQIVTGLTISLMLFILATTCWVVDGIQRTGIASFDFQSRTYRIFLWSRNGALPPLCFGFLAYGILLYRNVSGALQRPSWDPDTAQLNAVKAKVLKRIVLVVSASTLLWFTRLIMMIIWEVQTNYSRLDDTLDFSGRDKENQFLWQLLSQIIPFFGMQTVMLCMIKSSNGKSKPTNGSHTMKKGLVINSRGSNEGVSYGMNDSFDTDGGAFLLP